MTGWAYYDVDGNRVLRGGCRALARQAPLRPFPLQRTGLAAPCRDISLSGVGAPRERALQDFLQTLFDLRRAAVKDFLAMAAPIEGLRTRAKRLMRENDFRVEDLTKLFLYVRDQNDAVGEKHPRDWKLCGSS